ncbi:GNAT family N-acetyltransferase [Vacuolonema iberomarrocanum]|uniref:GNAT family N-acetyltransferase n=1 Tax=Vacuolonema iberomarrocanum TaxID=3454632 RepID=UPI001A028B39|nr:GNAT family N-acetyltransferase [filamentous cyanobacterium LEGE 07170]
MSQPTFLKVPFVWEKPDALIEGSSQLTFEPVKAVDHQLISTVARVMAESVDASDRRRTSEHDPHKAAEMFLYSAREDFAYQDDWWQFGINEKGEIVGFVLPVIFPGCAKEGLEEGTIYYMGVLPGYRGLGLANELLFKGTQILQEVGVWRVFCDTAMDNVRMIAAFKRVGYRQYGEPWERPV